MASSSDTSRITQKSWRGNWWSPGTEAAVAGELHQPERGNFRLDLAGQLHPERDNDFVVLGENPYRMFCSILPIPA